MTILHQLDTLEFLKTLPLAAFHRTVVFAILKHGEKTGHHFLQVNDGWTHASLTVFSPNSVKTRVNGLLKNHTSSRMLNPRGAGPQEPMQALGTHGEEERDPRTGNVLSFVNSEDL